MSISAALNMVANDQLRHDFNHWKSIPLTSHLFNSLKTKFLQRFNRYKHVVVC
jgi:hypothetical protein